MKKPLISIIVPVYNSAKYLEECLNSILFQSYTDFELLLVDDGSTDDSLSICKKYVSKDKRIQLIEQENSGAGAARNEGIKNAKGDFIVFSDADDIVSKDYLSFLLEGISSDCDIVCAEYKAFRTQVSFNDSFLTFRSISQQEAVSALLTQRISAGPVCKLYRSSLLKKCKFENYRVGEDLLLNYYYFKKCRQIRTSNHIIYGYRRNNISLTQNSFVKKRMDGLTVTSIIANSEKTKAAAIRHFMEAYFILESMDSSKVFSSFPEQVAECKKVLKENRLTVLFYKNSTIKQRIIAFLCIINPFLPARIVNRLRKRTA